MNTLSHIMVPVTDRLSLSLSNGGREGNAVSEVALMINVTGDAAARIGREAGFAFCTTRMPGLFSGLNNEGSDGSIEYCGSAEKLVTLIAKASEIGSVYVEMTGEVSDGSGKVIPGYDSGYRSFIYIDLREEEEEEEEV
jgi:hypothetical protein